MVLFRFSAMEEKLYMGDVATLQKNPLIVRISAGGGITPPRPFEETEAQFLFEHELEGCKKIRLERGSFLPTVIYVTCTPVDCFWNRNSRVAQVTRGFYVALWKGGEVHLRAEVTDREEAPYFKIRLGKDGTPLATVM